MAYYSYKRVRELISEPIAKKYEAEWAEYHNSPEGKQHRIGELLALNNSAERAEEIWAEDEWYFDNGYDGDLFHAAADEIQQLRKQVAGLEHCVENRAKQWAEQHIKIQKLEAENTMLIGEAEELKAKVTHYDRWLSNGVYFTNDEYKSEVARENALIKQVEQADVDMAELKAWVLKHGSPTPPYDIDRLTLQVQVLRDALKEIHTDSMVDSWQCKLAEKALNTTPNHDEWIRKDSLEEFSTQMQSGGRISKLYRIKETTK